MHSIARPVSVGLLLGLLTLIFGIAWAVFLTLNHDRIHDYLGERGTEAAKGGVITGGEQANALHSHHDHAQAVEEPHPDASHAYMHEEDPMDQAHERLTRGHIHAMGLGLISIAVSLIMPFLHAPNRIKAVASACAGVGGFFYPISWIIMGLRTVTLGPEAAEKSVVPIVALSVVFVLTGISLAFIYLVKGVLRGD
ncbi:MAG: hypothetical protein HZB85_09965 [Deltaproteobacteria bacterium]|nr:hypothetical protein [Deltaproteobacteria bacterium]